MYIYITLMGVVLVMLCASTENVSTVPQKEKSHVLKCTAIREAMVRVC
jgi:hypothetical protein